jgi:molybdate transport system regulatory protein
VEKKRRASRPRKPEKDRIPGGSTLHPRYRIFHKGRIVLGPGKADLLEAIARTGSIVKPARELEMSYMRAWTLIGVMNESFREPLVVAARGGTARGGADLSKLGERVLVMYRQMEQASLAAAAKDWKELKNCLC